MQRKRGVPGFSVVMMFLTLTVLACQGVDGFNPFATATPTATATFTPSPIPTFTPTFTPTATQTATPLPPSGRLREEQSDGTTIFIDYDGNYQLVFPEGWVVVFLEKDELIEALDRLPDQETTVSEMIKSTKNTDVNNVVRAVGFNFDAQQGVYTPNISITYDINPLSSGSSVKNLTDARIAYFSFLNIKVVHTEIKETSSRIKIGMIEMQWSMKGPGGRMLNVHQKQVLFKSGEGVVTITYSTVNTTALDLNTDLEKLIESIQILDL